MSLCTGPKIRKWLTTSRIWAWLQKERGESAAANASLRRALAIYEKAFGQNSPQALKLRENLNKARVP